MPYTVAYNHELKILEIKAWGELNMQQIKQLMFESIHAARDNDCTCILSDYHEAVLEVTTLDIYGLPGLVNEVSSSISMQAARLKRALIINRAAQDFKFFETVTLNRGQFVKLFDTREDALQWLLPNQRQE